ncbi:AsnC family transcriptional regulator [Rhodanobacter sp. FW510-R12]|uniref:Lrp/AsnC family transcriptional regulator n=1 Tax=unclassified Rhodanobacter TaxID=2621553 RepID=UPI0007AA251F|nr:MULTISPECIES: Lrp/AsnC family transcriptional regulator [unclassified Rhodanobacter]KZC15811.1 AsnC family transcriptional regulator [Rhodanobacter sp. FW104-R8]KZC27849.1 AsnC family transcriptional regulator [Rhodanobacter sp. FW510-T8]KZC32036.1 AsnC family transcriptional regulator [Rhodanobacter sp. FW510-R10]
MESKVTEAKPELDGKDWQLLEALQADARLGYAELGRKVRLSAPAVAERVKRLEEAGVITGYRAVVEPKRLGYRIEAMVRLRCDGGICARIGPIVADIPEVLDCRRLAGEDSALLHVVAMSISHLESVLDRLLKIHASISTTTLVVLQAPHVNRAINRAMWDAACKFSAD